MKRHAYLLALIATMAWAGAHADSHGQDMEAKEGHPYVGFGINSLALDNDRVPGVPTSSPGHASKTANLILGYQFNDLWAADLSLGTDFSGEVGADAFAINGYRFFGSSAWRPYVSAGLSHLSVDDAPDDDTQQIQAGFGIAGNLNRNLELRVGYQRLHSVSDGSFNDNAVGVALNWHFRKPETVAQVDPQPETVPVEKEVVETVELLVQFDFDKSVIKSAFEPQFQELAQALRDNPDQSITIEGHTCWIGTEEYNQGLSERRANAVRQKLIDDYGIDPGRLDAIGYGESRPVADNNILEGRQRNRRAIAVIMQTRTVTE